MNSDGPNDSDLRVLFVVDSLFPGLGGAEVQAMKLATALCQRGIHIDFIAPRERPTQALRETWQGFTITRIAFPRIRWIGSIVLLLRTVFFLHAKRHDYDAVHVHVTHLMAAAAGFARRMGGLPVVAKVSGYYEFAGGVLDPDAGWKPLNRLIRRGLADVDAIQTISEQTRTRLISAGFREDQIAFIPNGIDISTEIPSAKDSQTLRIGYCGRMREVKGIQVLLSAFALLHERRPDLNMVLSLAGEGNTRVALQSQAVELDIAASLEWLGQIDMAATGEFLAGLDIYVQPSFAEGLSNSVMEAMLAARAVIATNVGGNIDLVTHGENGLLVPPGDAIALCAAMLRLVDAPDERRAFGQRARAKIENHYSFDAVIDHLLPLYSGLGAEESRQPGVKNGRRDGGARQERDRRV